MSKKIEEGRPFNVYNGERPKVLLIGNGIPRAFGGEKSWDDLLEAISDGSIPLPITNDMPMPLKATLLSKNELTSKVTKLVKSQKWGFSVDEPQKKFLQRLFNLKFDYILTTNYAYEIECALLDKLKVEENEIDKLKRYYSDGMQKKFFINTCNDFKDKKVSVWHIHGEVGLPDSIALNNEYYGKLTGRYYEWIDDNFNSKNTKKIASWIDAFLYGNLYILGFGMDFSETDLWWLLQYKTKNRDSFFGETVFFDKDLKKEAKKDCKAWCKNKLFEVLNVKVEDCGYEGNDYPVFYKKAYECLKKEVGERTKK